jgi:hypothetical protein
VQITLAMLNRSFLRATFAYKSGLLDNPPSQVMRILTTISFYFFFFQKVTNGYFINIKTKTTSFGFNLSFFFPFFFFFFFLGNFIDIEQKDIVSPLSMVGRITRPNTLSDFEENLKNIHNVESNLPIYVTGCCKRYQEI